ncbi:tRNA (adenosine(37)-N6)-threonylcarbamoyltransferase complex ATPase subunit type 1 TsaE [Candidatus Omnitrophota bacterium]
MLTTDMSQTKDLGRKIAGLLKPGDVLALTGDLGAGKTTFTKGIAKGLGVDNPDYVNSPTFVLVKEYAGRANLYHFDFYRINNASEVEYLSPQEYYDKGGIVVIEWAEKFKELLPDEYLHVIINIKSEKEREFKFKGHGKRYLNLISRYLK